MTPEEEADHKLALELHAQLNSMELPPEDTPAPAPAASAPNHDTSQDRALAHELQLQWQNEPLPQNGFDIPDLDGFVPDLDGLDDDDLDPDSEDGGYHPLSRHRYAHAMQAFKDQQKKLSAALEQNTKEVLQSSKDDGAVYSQDARKSAFNANSLGDFMVRIRNEACIYCNDKFIASPKAVIAMFKDWKAAKGGCLSSQIQCTQCKYTACISCGSTRDPGNLSWVQVHGKKVSWCCDNGRMLLIWVILCGFDDQYKPVKSMQPSSTRAGFQKRIKANREELEDESKKRKSGYEDNGVGFGGPGCDSLFGSPFRALGKGRTLGDSDGLSRVQRAQVDEDTFGGMVLKLLTRLLPVPARGTSFDQAPPGPIPNILLESSILSYSASLLRNDSSLDDILARRMVYESLFPFVATLGTHPMTSGLVFNQRLVRSGESNLLLVSFQDMPGVPEDTGEPLANALRKLATTSNLFTKHAQGKGFSTKDGQDILTLAKKINHLWRTLKEQDIGRSIAPAPAIEAAIASGTATSPPAALDEVPDEVIMATHAFVQMAKGLKDAPRGRMKRLITEIASLGTGLPPGIFVRYSADRPDVMKAIIIGPSGTPYENGIFEFDIWATGNYPNEPPKVLFKTTGKGRVRFNPNLYECGKVCLSLLGTWQGEPWKPGESTLLQVLVSIQAMILCDDPWFNEPGRERGRGNSARKAQSDAYNKSIRTFAIEHAILYYAEGQDRSGVWKDVISHHFTHQANKILETAQGWATASTEKADGLPQYFDEEFHAPPGPLAPKLKKLQEVMRKYGATFEMDIKEPSPDKKAPTPKPQYHHPGLMHFPSLPTASAAATGSWPAMSPFMSLPYGPPPPLAPPASFVVPAQPAFGAVPGTAQVHSNFFPTPYGFGNGGRGRGRGNFIGQGHALGPTTGPYGATRGAFGMGARGGASMTPIPDPPITMPFASRGRGGQGAPPRGNRGGRGGWGRGNGNNGQ